MEESKQINLISYAGSCKRNNTVLDELAVRENIVAPIEAQVAQENEDTGIEVEGSSVNNGAGSALQTEHLSTKAHRVDGELLYATEYAEHVSRKTVISQHVNLVSVLFL